MLSQVNSKEEGSMLDQEEVSKPIERGENAGGREVITCTSLLRGWDIQSICGEVPGARSQLRKEWMRLKYYLWFINFVYLFEEPTFSFIDLFYCFFSLYFIYFCSDIYDFLPATNLGFCLFFFF